MKTLFFVLSLMIGCGKDTTHKSPTESQDQEQEEKDPQMGEYQPPVVLSPDGIIPAEDCQHIDIGDKACNFRLADQDGTTWELYSHEGDVIVMIFSTVWCPPCQSAGYYTQSIQDDYENDSVQIITILIDGAAHGIEPTDEEVDTWVEDHSITTAAILQGSRDKMLDITGVEGYSIGGFPTYFYLDRDMRFYAGHVGFNDEYVRQIIEEGL